MLGDGRIVGLHPALGQIAANGAAMRPLLNERPWAG